jgi:hypothetical protein
VSVALRRIVIVAMPNTRRSLDILSVTNVFPCSEETEVDVPVVTMTKYKTAKDQNAIPSGYFPSLS